MTASPAAAPTMTSRAIESNLHISLELAEQLDPMERFSLNELLDRIAALGVATDYDQIGLNLIKERLTLPRLPTTSKWWKNNAASLRPP